MITKAADIVLKVRPVFFGIEHLYFYEGPCRMVGGERLQPGYDKIGNEMFHKNFLEQIDRFKPEGVEILDTVRGIRTDDWENKESMWDEIKAAISDADVAFIFSNIGVDDLALEFAKRYDIPMIICPTSFFSPCALHAAVEAKWPEKKIYCPISWGKVPPLLSAFRAKKVINNTRVLLASRGNSDVGHASMDTFSNHDEIWKSLGVQFRHMSIHELLDQIAPVNEEGNYTTPGRKTNNLTDEDYAEIKKMADELLEGSSYTDLSREYLENSLAAYVTVKKVLDFYDCNAVAIPCPDSCSTRRLNEKKLTFCFSNSLLNEQGIPSACEFDSNAAVSMQALIAVSGQSPYIGNTSQLVYENGSFLPFTPGLTAERMEGLKDNPENLYYMNHAVPHRCLRSPKNKEPYALNHFAYEQKFGAVFRYDFERDKDQIITLCRFSPDGKKILVGKGTIVGGDGYLESNCNTTIIFRVTDQDKFYEQQCHVGNHLSLVYGDYTEELKMLADVLGIEALEC